MWLNKVINKIRNTDKINKLTCELNAKDRDITCYQRANDNTYGEGLDIHAPIKWAQSMRARTICHGFSMSSTGRYY